MNINKQEDNFCFLCLQRNCDQERAFTASKLLNHSKHSFNVVLQQEFQQLENSMYEQLNKQLDELLSHIRSLKIKIGIIMSEIIKNISLTQQINAHFILQDYDIHLQRLYKKTVEANHSFDIIFKNLGFESIQVSAEKGVQAQMSILQYKNSENNLDIKEDEKEELKKETESIENLKEEIAAQYQSIYPKQIRYNNKVAQLYDDIFKYQLDQNKTTLLNIILRRGQNLYSQKQFVQAIQMFDFILCFDQKKEAQEAYYYKGLTFSQMEKNQESLSCYEQALQLDPKNSAYLQAKGYQLFELKKYIDSINCCDQVLQIDSKNVQSLNTKGNCLHQINKFEEAILCYDEAIKINKKYSPTYFNKGIALRSKNKLKEALENFSQAISLDPNNIKYYQQKQDLEKILEKAELEKKNAQKAINKDPKNPELYRKYGDILFLQKHHSEAIEIYEKALVYGYSEGEKLKGIITKLKQQEQKQI